MLVYLNHYWVIKYLISVYLKIVLPLLGYELSNVGIFKPLLFNHYWVIMLVYLNIVLPLLGYEISNVGIFKYCFTIIGL